MVCGKCGAEYDNTFEKCPYCGEVFKIPGSEDKNNKKVYSKNVRKLARTLHIKEEISEKIIKSVPYVLVIVVVFLCLFGVYKYFSGVGSKAYKIKQKNINQLEKFIKEENYEKVYEKMLTIKNPLDSDEYICYYSVGEIYAGGKEYIENSLDVHVVFSSEEQELINNNVEGALKSLTEVYFRWDTLNIKYGDVKNVSEYSEKMLKWFVSDAIENYKLSEEEVYEVMREGYGDEPVIESYADVVFRRVRATGDAYITDDDTEVDTNETIEE